MLKLTLVTPTKKLAVDLAIDEIFMPAFRGELNILPGHAPLVTSLGTGVLRYRQSGERGEFKSAAISWGYCEVYDDHISILAETAEFPEEIDVARAQLAFEKAAQAVAIDQPDPFTFERYHLKLERAQVRLQVAQGRSPLIEKAPTQKH